MGDEDSVEIPINVEEKETITFKEIEWKNEHEKILVDWADKGMCYRWLHSKSHQVYSSQNAWYTIPVIIMSTLTGTANFAQERFPESIKLYAPMMIGAVNIFAGILTTIQQFLKIAELNEAHRVAGIAWDKFYRNIKVELAKCPEERIHVGQMLKISKEEFDRLMETCPAISDKIVAQFEEAFSDRNGTTEEAIQRHKNFSEVSKPEICDELISTENYRYKRVITNASEIAAKASVAESVKRKQKILSKLEDQVRDFIKEFASFHNRNPLRDEIIENMQDKMSITILDKLIIKLSDEGSIILTNGENNV
jgi:hypothetical protein